MTPDRATRRKVVVIGAGPGGLCMGIKLKEAGFDDFEGPAFHSARWDHSCELEGRAVAVVGSAASAPVG